MESKKKLKRQARVSQSNCAACGACANVCPLGAITIPLGICAEIDLSKCVGCGRCARECPASVITITETA